MQLHYNIVSWIKTHSIVHYFMYMYKLRHTQAIGRHARTIITYNPMAGRPLPYGQLSYPYIHVSIYRPSPSQCMFVHAPRDCCATQ